LPKQEKVLDFKTEKELLLSTFEGFELVEDDFFKTLSKKVKELWTIGNVDAKYKPAIQRTSFR
jgi:hypothetical protein